MFHFSLDINNEMNVFLLTHFLVLKPFLWLIFLISSHFLFTHTQPLCNRVGVRLSSNNISQRHMSDHKRKPSPPTIGINLYCLLVCFVCIIVFPFWACTRARSSPYSTHSVYFLYSRAHILTHACTNSSRILLFPRNKTYSFTVTHSHLHSHALALAHSRAHSAYSSSV